MVERGANLALLRHFRGRPSARTPWRAAARGDRPERQHACPIVRPPGALAQALLQVFGHRKTGAKAAARGIIVTYECNVDNPGEQSGFAYVSRFRTPSLGQAVKEHGDPFPAGMAWPGAKNGSN
jgi:hypothetical protein